MKRMHPSWQRAVGVTLALACSTLMACAATQTAINAADLAQPVERAPYVGGGHILLYAPDIGIAMEKALASGFDVVAATPDTPPKNAMIYLDNGWFIEFVNPDAFPASVAIAKLLFPELRARLNAWGAHGPGDYFDWSVDVSDINAARDVAIRNGVALTKVREFSRVQKDGSETTWELSIPSIPHLPFFKSPYKNHLDITDRMAHPNGARSLAGFTVVDPNIEATRDALSRVLAIAPNADGSLCVGDVEIRLESGPEPDIREIRLISETTTGKVDVDGGSVTLIEPGEGPCR